MDLARHRSFLSAITSAPTAPGRPKDRRHGSGTVRERATFITVLNYTEQRRLTKQVKKTQPKKWNLDKICEFERKLKRKKKFPTSDDADLLRSRGCQCYYSELVNVVCGNYRKRGWCGKTKSRSRRCREGIFVSNCSICACSRRSRRAYRRWAPPSCAHRGLPNILDRIAPALPAKLPSWKTSLGLFCRRMNSETTTTASSLMKLTDGRRRRCKATKDQTVKKAVCAWDFSRTTSLQALAHKIVFNHWATWPVQ